MGTKKILVIDDNEGHRNAIRYLLKKQNYNVLAAQSGESGLKYLSKYNDIQVVIVDLAMLELSGVDLLETIKDRKYPLQRIVVTAHDEELSSEKAEELKLFAYLNKPVKKHSLLFTIKSAFNELYYKNLEKELNFAKEWQKLAKNIENFLQNMDKKVRSIPNSIELVKKELKNSTSPINSKLDEIINVINQVIHLKDEAMEKSYAGSRPRVFIGSSKEAIEIAREIELQLADETYPSLWKNSFEISTIIIESLIENLMQFDFAVFVLNADDLLTSRDVTSKCPRDNIIFEIGLFMGHLGRSRVFLVREDKDKIKLPSDFAGILTATYDGQRDLTDAISPVSTKILKAMKKTSKQVRVKE